MFTFYLPTRLHLGAGSLSVLSTCALPYTKALIVTTAGNSVRKFGYLDHVVSLLAERGITSVIFNNVLSNPIRAHVMEGAALCKQERCDVVVALGGGSAIDSAKCIAAMAVNSGDLWDYIAAGSGKGRTPKNPALPIIAITTTAGTGSEADPWAVTTNEETSEKIDFGNESTFPTLSIIDPELMRTVPPALTAYQGFDALFHSTEGFIATVANPISDALAIKAIELIAKYLPRAVQDGNDMEARENVAIANTISGMVESTSNCTSEHSIEHALSGFHPKLPHGVGLIAISLPYYERFVDAAAEKYILMAKAMGEDVDALPELLRPRAFLTALQRLQESCNVTSVKLSEYGVCRQRAREYAQFAYDTMGELFEVDPRELAFEETVAIIEEAYL